MEECVKEKTRISFECKTHTKFQPQLLSLDNSNENASTAFFCSRCLNLYEEELRLENLLSIDDLLEANEQTIIPKWPLLINQKLLYKINRFVEDQKKFARNSKNIVTSYFDSLKLETIKFIEEVEKQMLHKCDQIPQIEENLLNAYNQISEKVKMRKIFTEPNTTYEQACKQLKEILEVKTEQKQENQNCLEKAFNPFIQIVKQFDQNKPNEIKNGIFKMIQSINFFQKQTSDSEDVEQTLAYVQLPKLMNAKQIQTNPYTEQLLVQELQKKHFKYPFIFDSIKVINASKDNDTPQLIDIKSESLLQKLEQVCENITKKQEDIEVKPQVKLLLELITSPSNYLTNEFSQLITTIIKQLSPFFEQIDINNCYLKNKAPINFKRLQLEQVELIEKLVDKMIEKGYSEEVDMNKIKQNLPNTKIILSLLQNKFINQQQLSLLIQNHPIFESVKVEAFTFSKAVVNNSKINLRIDELENYSQVKFTKLNDNQWASVLSDQYLNKNVTYKIQFEINPKNTSQFHFMFGLTSLGKNKTPYADKLSFGVYYANKNNVYSGYGMDKVKKGIANNLKSCKQFELAVNLSKGILEITDFPEQNIIVEVDDDKKDRLKADVNYQFGLSIYNLDDEIIIKNILIIQN